MVVAIARRELDASGLRRAAARLKDADAARRMLALALVLDGHTRADAAGQCGMDRQTLRDGVHSYNEHGCKRGCDDSRKCQMNIPHFLATA